MNDREQYACGTVRFLNDRFLNEEEKVMENLF